LFISKCNNKPLAAGHRLEGELIALDIGGGEGGKGVLEGMGWVELRREGTIRGCAVFKILFKKALIEIYNN